MPSDGRKLPAPWARHLWRSLMLVSLTALTSLSACGCHNRCRTINVDALESAPDVAPGVTRRAIVADTTELGDLCSPLGRRLGLIQISSERQWERLRDLAPELGAPPDFRHGAVIGLASNVGLPLNGTWPIHLETVRVHDGAGYAIAHFQGGSFLPDGTTYVETAQIDGLSVVLMVEVNGTRFYP